jgi:rifampicin phosphotransferase
MAVMIMPMIAAKEAGVLFTRHPMRADGTMLVESSDTHEPKNSVPPQAGECEDLRTAAMAEIETLAERAHQMFGRPQDIEWAIDLRGRTWILQSRDISVQPAAPRVPQAPGPGVWRVIDHITHPSSRCLLAVYYQPMEDGWNANAERIGLTARVRIRSSERFMYYQPFLAGRNDEAESRASKFLEGDGLAKEMFDWDHRVKPESVRELATIQSLDLASLGDLELARHVRRCGELAARMVAVHHGFTCTAFVGLGDVLRTLREWSGWSFGDILSALGGGRDFVRADAQIRILIKALRREPGLLIGFGQLRGSPEQAGALFGVLVNREDELGRGMRHLRDRYGYLVCSGYDITSDTYRERPDLLLASIRGIAVSPPQQDESCDFAVERLRPRVPAKHHSEIRPLVERAVASLRLRDERGFCSDLWSMGILRAAYLEAGRRLSERGVLNDATLVTQASPRELVSWLETGTTEVPERELAELARLHRSSHVANVPPALGQDEPSTNPPPQLGPAQARMLAAFATAMELAVDRPLTEDGQSPASSVIRGVPASKGRAQGPARVFRGDQDLPSVRLGDVIVVRQATVALNAVLPMAAALVSEGGGILSHQAILAREYAKPCVVSCAGLLGRVRDGSSLLVDGGSGEVVLDAQEESQQREVSSLVGNYLGALRGRNRARALNHVGVVRDRVHLIQRVRASETAMAALLKHHEGLLATPSAVERVCSQAGISRTDLAAFCQRLHIELHPTDMCQMDCTGCTYRSSGPPSNSVLPYLAIELLLSLFRPKAVTIVGGGEPALYASVGRALGDLIVNLGERQIGVGLISNGVCWPPGDPAWPRWVRWIRFSLDAGCAGSYGDAKRLDAFDAVVANTLRVLRDTQIPEVGIGFLYHPGNAHEMVEVVKHFHGLLQTRPACELKRFNIQFRPWRDPVDCKPIDVPVLAPEDVRSTEKALSDAVRDESFRRFVHDHTNLATNLLCAGAREGITSFSECLVGMAKLVVRANGTVFPCFGMAAKNDPAMACGNIMRDDPETVGLRLLHVLASEAPTRCPPKYRHCLFAMFNNLLERGLADVEKPDSRLADQYFF